MQQIKYALGRFGRMLGSRGYRTSDRIVAWSWSLYAILIIVFFAVALTAGIRSEAQYNSTLGAQFYQADLSHDPGQIANSLEAGVAGVTKAGLASGHSVLFMPEDPSNDTAVTTKGLESLIARANAVDKLDHTSPAYQLGLQDLKTRIDGVSYTLYFERWTRLDGFWAATFRSSGWACWNSFLLACIAAFANIGVIFGLIALNKAAWGWEGERARA